MVTQVHGQLRPSRSIGPRTHSTPFVGDLPSPPDAPTRPRGPGDAIPPASRSGVRLGLTEFTVSAAECGSLRQC